MVITITILQVSRKSKCADTVDIWTEFIQQTSFHLTFCIQYSKNVDDFGLVRSISGCFCFIHVSGMVYDGLSSQVDHDSDSIVNSYWRQERTATRNTSIHGRGHTSCTQELFWKVGWRVRCKENCSL